MGKSDKAVDLVDTIFDEGFETYSKVKAAEKRVDFLLDMCGVPLEETRGTNPDPLGSSMYLTGRHYDHPRKIRVKPIASVKSETPVDEIEIDSMSEAGLIYGEENPDNFEAESPNDLPEQEPAKEATPQKKQNKINHVPNQNAKAHLKSVRADMLEEIRSKLKESELEEALIGSSAAKQAILKAKKLQAAYRSKGKYISLKQANRIASRA